MTMTIASDQAARLQELASQRGVTLTAALREALTVGMPLAAHLDCVDDLCRRYGRHREDVCEAMFDAALCGNDVEVMLQADADEGVGT